MTPYVEKYGRWIPRRAIHGMIGIHVDDFLKGFAKTPEGQHLQQEIGELRNEQRLNAQAMDGARNMGNDSWASVGPGTIPYRDPYHSGLSKRTPTGQQRMLCTQQHTIWLYNLWFDLQNRDSDVVATGLADPCAQLSGGVSRGGPALSVRVEKSAAPNFPCPYSTLHRRILHVMSQQTRAAHCPNIRWDAGLCPYGGR